MFEITVQTHFAAAHAIRLPDGTFETLHGHDWQVWVTVGRTQLDDIETVLDFHELQAMLHAIVKPFAQNNLNDLPPFTDGKGGLAINPTTERLAQYIAEQLAEQLPNPVSLLNVAVEEAPGCIARVRLT